VGPEFSINLCLFHPDCPYFAVLSKNLFDKRLVWQLRADLERYEKSSAVLLRQIIIRRVAQDRLASLIRVWKLRFDFTSTNLKSLSYIIGPLGAICELESNKGIVWKCLVLLKYFDFFDLAADEKVRVKNLTRYGLWEISKPDFANFLVLFTRFYSWYNNWYLFIDFFIFCVVCIVSVLLSFDTRVGSRISASVLWAGASSTFLTVYAVSNPRARSWIVFFPYITATIFATGGVASCLIVVSMMLPGGTPRIAFTWARAVPAALLVAIGILEFVDAPFLSVRTIWSGGVVLFTPVRILIRLFSFKKVFFGNDSRFNKW